MARASFSAAAAMLMLCAGAYAQTQPAVPGTAAVAGRVTDAVTGEPVSGANLRLLQMRTRGGPRVSLSGISQADGSFHFDALGAGTYILRGDRAGYLPSSRFAAADRIRLDNGQFLNDVSLKLTPESAISGRVYDEGGKAVAGVRVRALQKSMSSGRVDLEERSSGETDQNGAFSIGKIRPGKYVVVADPPPQTGHDEGNPNGELVTTLYPRALNVDEADELEIAAGYSPSDIKMYLKRSAAYHVRGRIAEGIGYSRDRTLLLSPRAAGASMALARTVRVNKDGRFDADGVLAGDYILRVVGGRRSQLLARATVAVSGGDVNNVVVAALPPVTVSGTVTVSGGELTNIAAWVHVVARPLLEDYSSATVAQVASDGTFRFAELDPEEWLFSVAAGANGYYLKSILSNGQDVHNKPIDLSEFPSVRLEVSLQSGAATISGTVQVTEDDDPAGITVLLVPKQVDAIGSNVQFRSSQKGGAFVFTNLSPDEYTLFAVHQPDVDLWQSTAFLQQMAAEGTPVEVAENQQQQVQLKVTPYEQVAEAAMRAGVPEN